MTKLTERFWPEYCAKNRPFLSEDQIVMDLVNKIKGSRSSLLWWVLTEECDLLIYSKKNHGIVIRYYGIASPRNSNFSKSERPEEIQLRILKKVWKIIHILDEQWLSTHDGIIES